MKSLILLLIVVLLVVSCGGVEQTTTTESKMPENFTYLGRTESYDSVYRITDGDVVCYLASHGSAVDLECLP
jgi:hypothetical protein